VLLVLIWEAAAARSGDRSAAVLFLVKGVAEAVGRPIFGRKG
jgi:hypothetical protein